MLLTKPRKALGHVGSSQNLSGESIYGNERFGLAPIMSGSSAQGTDRNGGRVSFENEPRMISVLLYLRPTAGIRCRPIAILPLFSACISLNARIRLPARQLRDLNKIAAGVVQHGDL